MYTMHVPGTHGGQRKATGQMDGHVSTGNWT